MDLYESKALMRFTASISLNELPTKTNTLIDTSTSLKFISKDVVMANGF